jgi:hypothetical protein
MEAVLKQAGGNRSELEKVLKHYGKRPADSLKFRAAEFLIENMPDKYSVEYDVPFENLMTFFMRLKGIESQRAVDEAYGSMKPVIKEDVKYITSDYLINNIDLAFKMWEEQPWGKDVPFDVFCEDILPYRVTNEPLENWREKVLAAYGILNSSFKDQPGITVVEACTQANSQIPIINLSTDIPDMNYSMLMTARIGMCDEMAKLAIFVMRALGIPVANDYTLKWPDNYAGHSWNSLYVSGKRLPFMGIESNPDPEHEDPILGRHMPKSKIYRRTFGKQEHINANSTDIPPELHDRYMKDISSEYFTPDTLFPNIGGCKLEIPVKYQPSKNTGYAYLATRGLDNWNIVGWGKTDTKTIDFGLTGKNITYLPLYCADNILTPAHYPFWLGGDDSIHIFEPDTDNYRQLRVREISTATYDYLGRMNNGIFEGANRADFSDAKVLHTVKNLDGAYFYSAKIRNPQAYRYIRYVSPEESYGNVAEIELYDDKGKKLGGKPFCSPFGNDDYTCDKVFDGDIMTFYDGDISGSWIAMDLGELQTIAEIRYFPRHEGNFIYSGYTYDLFCWKGMDWQLFERQTATSHFLDFQIPVNGMYYLKDVATGQSTRWFTLDENGERIWILR